MTLIKLSESKYVYASNTGKRTVHLVKDNNECGFVYAFGKKVSLPKELRGKRVRLIVEVLD